MKRFKALDLLLHSEARARRFLSDKSWPNKTPFCIRCRSRKIYRLADKRYRCGQCGYTFQEFAGRWIAELQMGAAKWLWALKLFELELPAERLAEEIGISHPTALKVIRLIRLSIVQSYVSPKPTTAEAFWQTLLNDALQKDVSAARRHIPAVLKIQERNGTIGILPVHNLSAASLLKLQDGVTKLGQVSYVRPRDKGELLMVWGGGRLSASQRTPSMARRAAEKRPIEEFLGFAEQRLMAARRISRQQFLLYLMEIKFRYDHRNEDIFDLLASAISQLVPNR